MAAKKKPPAKKKVAKKRAKRPYRKTGEGALQKPALVSFGAKKKIVLSREDGIKFGFTNSTQQEVADFFGISKMSVNRMFKDDDNAFVIGFKEGLAKCQQRLKRTIMAKAEAGDNACLIFSLKNICGWTDRTESNENKEVTVVMENHEKTPRFLQDLSKES